MQAPQATALLLQEAGRQPFPMPVTQCKTLQHAQCQKPPAQVILPLQAHTQQQLGLHLLQQLPLLV
jgi:hypothetical protein